HRQTLTWCSRDGELECFAREQRTSSLVADRYRHDATVRDALEVRGGVVGQHARIPIFGQCLETVAAIRLAGGEQRIPGVGDGPDKRSGWRRRRLAVRERQSLWRRHILDADRELHLAMRRVLRRERDRCEQRDERRET